MEKVKLAAPWTIFYRQMQKLFEGDKDIRIIYDEDAVSIKLYVASKTKAEALTELLPTEKEFGNIVMNIVVIPGNEQSNSINSVYDAFNGNEAVSDIHTVEYLAGDAVTYVIFKKRVVQFFNDDISDAHGVCSTLYQEIAKEVFGSLKGVFFCTELGVANTAMHMDRWP